jgi:hypothetical protein
LTTSLARIAWVIGWPSSPTEPSITSTPGRQNRVMNAASCDSVTTMSALASSSTARTVSRPGSPGPAPTKATLPLDVGLFFLGGGVTELAPT